MTWLDAEKVGAVLGADLAGPLDQDKLDEACDAARAYVEEKRPDLWVTDAMVDPPVSTYTPGAGVVYGAALFAHRLYHRTRSPLGVVGATSSESSGILREDPDIARLLGIGRSRGFRFGAGPTVTTEAVV